MSFFIRFSAVLLLIAYYCFFSAQRRSFFLLIIFNFLQINNYKLKQPLIKISLNEFIFSTEYNFYFFFANKYFQLNLLMSDNQKIFKFIFTAHISKLVINANVNSPLIVTWKRSKQSVSTTPVELVNGTASIEQTIKLPVNMYQDINVNQFLEKKSQFNFTMTTPKGDKSAGAVVVDLASILNQKMTFLEKDFPLEKCPVKDSYVHMNITAECTEQKGVDNMSLQNQSYLNNDACSMQIESAKKILSQTKISNQNIDKDQIIRLLKSKVGNLQNKNKQLQKQIKVLKNQSGDKKISKKKIAQQNEHELSKVRNKLEVIYQNLKRNLSGLP